MKTHILLFGVALGATCFCRPAYSQWAVVDVDAIAQLTHQVQQGAQQIQYLDNQYNQMKAMAQRMYGLSRYRSPKNVFEAIKYADQYATVAQWAAGENTGQNVEDGYAATTVVAQADDFLGRVNAGISSSRRAMYSTQEIMDGNNIAAIRAVGQIRNAASQYEAAISELESDSEDEDDSAQAQLAVEQRTSNAAIVQLRQTKDTNTLLSAQLDQMVAQTKLQRDALAASGNDVLTQQQSFDDYDAVYAGAADSWMNWDLSPHK